MLLPFDRITEILQELCIRISFILYFIPFWQERNPKKTTLNLCISMIFDIKLAQKKQYC